MKKFKKLNQIKKSSKLSCKTKNFFLNSIKHITKLFKLFTPINFKKRVSFKSE